MARKPTYLEKVLADAKGLGYLARQGLAGAAEATIANSSQHKGWYRPAVVDAIPSVAGIVKTLATGKAPEEGSFLARSMARSQLASERTNQALGIEAPRNTGETAWRVIGSMIVPAPKGAAVAKAFTKAGAAKPVAAISRAVAAVPKPVRAVARGVSEIAMPLRQTKTVKGTGAVAAIGTAIGDPIAEAVDPNYKSSVLDGAFDKAPAPAEDDFFASLEQDDPATTEDDFFAQLETEPEEPEIDAVEKETQEWTWEQGAMALGALALGAGALRFGPELIKARQGSIGTETPTFTHKRYRRSLGGKRERMTTAVIQQDQPLRNLADEFMSPAQANDYKFKADLINNVSIGSRVADFLRTGRPPGATMRTRKLAPIAEGYAKELNLDEQRAVSDALLAQSALDDAYRTGKQSSLTKDANGNPVDVPALRAMVDAARANPKYVKYMDAVTQSYQDLLRFRVQRGTLSAQEAGELMQKRPNYVRMARDLETEAKAAPSKPFNANENRLGPRFARTEEDAGGISGTTGAGNPFNALLEDWATHIRVAEINDLRSHWLSKMDGSGATTVIEGKTVPLVQRITNGTAPDTAKGDHVITINGKDQVFRVNDARISDALDFAPRATIQALETARQIAQNTVTGPLGTLMNGFAVFKSPIYDTTLGMMLKPDNVHLGLINEGLSKVGMSIGRADPTALVSAYTGAARYAWDDLRGAMAQNLSDQLVREHSWLRNMLGDTKVTALRDSLQASYENSIKSLMDAQGISSLTMHGSPDPSTVMVGLEGVTPRFSSAMSEQLARDTMKARASGQVGPMKDMLTRDAAGFAQIRAGSIARAYGGVLEAMHNGFRYSMVASNISRNADLAKLASQARRISVDSAQHGGWDAYNKGIGAFMYGNLTVQSLHAVAKRFKENPATFLANITSVALPALALHYVALASDPKAKEQHKMKSASQKAAALTTFGGAEIPIDPILRLMIHPLTTILDHVTGAHDGNWNGDYVKAMSTWIEGGYDEDAYTQDVWDTLKTDMISNFPFAPESVPGITAALAGAGIDPGMSRIASEAVPVRTQQQTGFNADKADPGAITSGYAENLIAALTGSFGQNLIQMSNDAYKAYNNGSGDVDVAIDAGLNTYRENLAKGSGALRPMVFQNHEQVASVSDTNWSIVKEKTKGVEAAVSIFQKDLSTAGEATSQSHRDAMGLEGGVDINPAIVGTQNMIIAGTANDLAKELKKIDTVLSGLSEKTAKARSETYLKKRGQKASEVNDLTKERRYYNLQKRQIIETYEQSVREALGDKNFSFEDYNPEDYMQPITGQQPR